jgi:peptidoglycan/xylan/chitin deacetylase (PgdA/CDA1 family)
VKLRFLLSAAAMILATASIGQVTHAGETPQVIVLKLDDVVAYRSSNGSPVSPRWQRITDFFKKSDVKASYGIIGFSLEEDNEAYFRWIRDLHESGLIEFWNHGYRNRRAEDTTGEFEGDFEGQKAALEKTQCLAREKLGIELKTFGPHWSRTNEHTARALESIPEIKTWFYGPSDSSKFVFPRYLTLENPTHVVDFARFKDSYERVGHDKKCLALQGHPNSWDDQRWTDFVRIIDYLESKGCVFMTPSEYMVRATGKAKDDDGEWIRLFNGRSLDGWVVKCLPRDNDKRGYWKVVDGTITAETPPGSKHNYIWLLTEKEYSDFELRAKVQTLASSTGNSGIQVRSRYDDEAGWLDGPQVDIHPPGPWRCGFIYDETREAKVWLWPDVGRPANAKPEHAPEGWKWLHADEEDAWNDIAIVCRGSHIRTVINGVTVADYDGTGRLDDEAHRIRKVGMKGYIGLQIHPGKQLLIRFKDIEVRELQ